MLCLVLGLDVDRHARPRDSLLKRVLDAVANVMRLCDGHVRRHHKMKLDERNRARGARLQVVGLDGAVRCFCDAGLDAGKRLRVYGLVHQAPDAILHKPPALGEDVKANAGGDDRVELQPACQNGRGHAQ